MSRTLPGMPKMPNYVTFVIAEEREGNFWVDTIKSLSE